MKRKYSWKSQKYKNNSKEENRKPGEAKESHALQYQGEPENCG